MQTKNTPGTGKDLHISNTENKHAQKPKRNSKLQWVILIALILGFVAFIIANTHVFSGYSRLINPSISSSQCGPGSSVPRRDIQTGVSINMCQSQNYQDTKRWEFVKDVSMIVSAVSSAVIAIGLLIVARQLFKLSKSIDRSRVDKSNQ